MDIEKFLTGTEFENLIPKFHEEGIAKTDDLYVIEKNAKLFEFCTKITNSNADAMKLNKLIKEMFAKRNNKLMLYMFLVIAAPFIFIMYLVLFG